jgi:hypothetical protein
VGRQPVVRLQQRSKSIKGIIHVTIALAVCLFYFIFQNDQKHPEQPKKPLSSFMLFFIEQKDAVMKKQPNLGMELKCQESSCYLV